MVEQQNGELCLPEHLRCRIRYFSDGVILGSRCFVQSHFFKLKEKLGYQRRRAATQLTALGGSDPLWVFRDLRVRPIGRHYPASEMCFSAALAVLPSSCFGQTSRALARSIACPLDREAEQHVDRRQVVSPMIWARKLGQVIELIEGLVFVTERFVSVKSQADINSILPTLRVGPCYLFRLLP